MLEEHGIERVEWRLRASYPKRDTACSTRRRALAFVSRLLEEEGIYWFSEDGDDGEKIVFADDSTAPRRWRATPAAATGRAPGSTTQATR